MHYICLIKSDFEEVVDYEAAILDATDRDAAIAEIKKKFLGEYDMDENQYDGTYGPGGFHFEAEEIFLIETIAIEKILTKEFDDAKSIVKSKEEVDKKQARYEKYLELKKEFESDKEATCDSQ